MSMDPLTAASAVFNAETQAVQLRPQSSPQADFARWMTDQLGDVNRQIGVAEQSLVQLASGSGNLHQVMLDLEKARTAFQLTMQVRNKLLEGYQEIMRMQI